LFLIVFGETNRQNDRCPLLSSDLQHTMTGRLQVTDPEDSGRFSQLPSQGAGSRIFIGATAGTGGETG